MNPLLVYPKSSIIAEKEVYPSDLFAPPNYNYGVSLELIELRNDNDEGLTNHEEL